VIDHANFAALCDRHDMVGAVVGWSSGGTRGAVGHGVADLATGDAVSVETNFLAGSVTKAMTATIVTQLVTEGRLSLDDRVVDVLAEFAVADPGATANVTVRHLLTHTAGFDGDIWPDDNIDILTHLSDAAQLFAPGSFFSYDNASYAVLGLIITRVLGGTFESAIDQHIAGPCNALITTDMTKLDQRPRATGHVRGDDGHSFEPTTVVEGPASMAAAGARTWCAIDGLLAFGEMHLRTPELAAMRKRQIVVPDPNNGGTMALGVFLDDRWGTPVVFHDGGVNGQSAYLRIMPEHDAVFALMSTGGVPQCFHRDVFRSLAHTSLGITAPQRAQANSTIVVDRARYVGTYGAAGIGVEVSQRQGALVAALTFGRTSSVPHTIEAIPLAAVDDRVFLMPLDGRDFVLVFPPPAEPCDHVLAGMRLLPRLPAHSQLGGIS